jgi:hypothetical protein
MRSRLDLRDYQIQPRRTMRRFVQSLAVGAVLGAIIGLLYIWAFAFSLQAFGAGLVGGTVAGGVLGGYSAVVDRPSGIAAGFVALGAGALGASAWWMLAAPAISLSLAAAIGAGIVALLMVAAKLELPV